MKLGLPDVPHYFMGLQPDWLVWVRTAAAVGINQAFIMDNPFQVDRDGPPTGAVLVLSDTWTDVVDMLGWDWKPWHQPGTTSFDKASQFIELVDWNGRLIDRFAEAWPARDIPILPFTPTEFQRRVALSIGQPWVRGKPMEMPKNGVDRLRHRFRNNGH